MFIYKCFISLVIFNKIPFIYDLFVDVYGLKVVKGIALHFIYYKL